jgi:hypothetical protein
VEACLVTIYIRLLVCLPFGFRDEFQDDMKQVFILRMQEARSQGLSALLWTFAGELLALLKLCLFTNQQSLSQFLTCLVVFAALFGIWILFAFVVANLAAFLPKEELVLLVGGGISMVGLFVALGVAARLVGRRLTRFHISPPDRDMGT